MSDTANPDGTEATILLTIADDETGESAVWVYTDPEEPGQLGIEMDEEYGSLVLLRTEEVVLLRDALNSYLDASDPLVEVAA